VDDANKNWPSWRYGPKGEAEVFNSESEVPKGWLEHPSLHDKKVPATPPAGDGPVLDAYGHPWDAETYAATKTQTKDGLWRLKVGVSRPAPAPGYPLDL
jgi:hypothetical protein